MRKNITNKSRKSQAGMTMIEGLAWMALAGIVVAGALVANASGWGGNKIRQDTTQLTSLFGNAKKLQDVSGYGAAGTNLIPAMVVQKLVPADMTASGNTLTNKYGGAITLVSTGIGYTLSSAGYPSEACMEVGRNISLAGSGMTTSINGGGAISGQVASATAAAQCTGTTNSVAWTAAN